ncbi:MAG: hypothetical protein ACKVU1_01670 [bacterium]
MLAFGVLLAATGCGSAPRAEKDLAWEGRVPQRVLVLPFENRSQSPGLALGPLMTDLFVSQLRHLSLTLLEPAHMMAAYDKAGRPVPAKFDDRALNDIADVTGCEAVIRGKITQYTSGRTFHDDRIGFEVRVLDARTGEALFTTAFVASGKDVDPSIRGIDQLTLFGVRQVTERIARAR